jgi:protoporphyrin/coproporphyrin ferrochelatase
VPVTDPYDALLVASFGGPEAPEDVLPFLENVTRGRGVPSQRLAEVAEHYDAFGGRSPINDQNRALVAAIRDDLVAHRLHLPVYWGNRNWHPYFAETLADMARDGVRRAAVLVTSAYSSYSGCRQYREDLATAAGAVGPGAPRLDKLRHYFDHPGFVAANADTLVDAVAQLPEHLRHSARVVVVTHSVPVAMEETSGPRGGAYSAQHRAAAAAVVETAASRIGVERGFDLVYCSRSGPPSVPWTEPDVNDHLRQLSARGVPAVVLLPLGFVSDHLEVRFDLDTEAAQMAADLGLPLTRAATAGTHPAFVAAIRELLLERAATERGECGGTRPACSPLGPSHDVCPAGCCANPRGPRPAVAGLD